MNQLLYITSNPHKATHMSRLLGYDIQAHPSDLPEIQSLDLKEVILHKTQTIFEQIQKPLFVDDVSLVIKGMNKLPGTFIKYFVQELGGEKICRIVDQLPTREALAQAMIGYHDGKKIHYFLGEISGRIADKPSGTRGYGWDEIFIPDGYQQIRAEMDEEDYDSTSPRTLALDQLKRFLENQ